MQIKYISSSPTRPPGLLRKAGVIIATVVLAGVALMFSAVLLALVLVVAVFGGAYLWWKTRELRKLMRNVPPPFQNAAKQDDAVAGEVFRNEEFRNEGFRGEVIEGEAVRVDESRAERERSGT